MHSPIEIIRVTDKQDIKILSALHRYEQVLYTFVFRFVVCTLPLVCFGYNVVAGKKEEKLKTMLLLKKITFGENAEHV